MIGDATRLTLGHVKRHIPPGSRLSDDVALLDIAQDLLLAHLHDQGVFEQVTFKGGTALRKLYAGGAGRFSTDIDLATNDPTADRHQLANLIAEQTAATLGPFTFHPAESRGRWRIRVTSHLGNPDVTLKLDVGPPCWLPADHRPFVPHPTHARYGFSLPTLPAARLEETVAEKIARLTRQATARDAADLIWIATTSPHAQIDRDIVRTLAVLKVWVDNHGLGPAWSPALNPKPFDPTRWLNPRQIWDDEQIGLLSHPPPSLDQLEADLFALYQWLDDLTDLQRRIGLSHAADRTTVLAQLRLLMPPNLTNAGLY